MANRLDHAKHNKAVCLFLKENTDFNDWIITTAFYSSVHFLRHKIFPFHSHYYKTKYETFDDYCADPVNRGENKHTLLQGIVEEKCSEETSLNFRKLKDLCWNARYLNYKLTQGDVTRALAYLDQIESECTAPKRVKRKRIKKK